MRSDLEHLEDVLTHLDAFHKCAVKMAKGLMASNQKSMALLLLKRAYRHDADKFNRRTFEYLRRGLDMTPEFDEERLKHAKRNRHHPECHGSIHEMADVDVGEMVCDWAARSGEFKTGLQDYIDNVASKRFGFTKKDDIYKRIMYFKAFVCDEAFKHQPPLLQKVES